MNTNTSENTTILNPQDRYIRPLNWLANGSILFVKYTSYIGYAGLILTDLATLIPFAIYSKVINLIFPSLTEAQKRLANEKTEKNTLIEQALNFTGILAQNYGAGPAIELLKSSRQSEFKNFLTMLTNIPTQERFWSSPNLLTWAIVQAILCMPFLVLSFIMDIYNQVILPAVILTSLSSAAIIYQINDLWLQIIMAPFTFYDKLFINDTSSQPITKPVIQSPQNVPIPVEAILSTCQGVLCIEAPQGPNGKVTKNNAETISETAQLLSRDVDYGQHGKQFVRVLDLQDEGERIRLGAMLNTQTLNGINSVGFQVAAQINNNNLFRACISVEVPENYSDFLAPNSRSSRKTLSLTP